MPINDREYPVITGKDAENFLKREAENKQKLMERAKRLSEEIAKKTGETGITHEQIVEDVVKIREELRREKNMENKFYITPAEAAVVFTCLAVVNDTAIYKRDTKVMADLYDRLSSWQPLVDFVKNERE